jgi:hypothetical protein
MVRVGSDVIIGVAECRWLAILQVIGFEQLTVNWLLAMRAIGRVDQVFR